MADKLPGGADRGAHRDGDTVVRTAGPWTPAVHALLAHLASKGFGGAPRPLGFDGTRERLTYLSGETVGSARPWPAFVHSEAALRGVARWLREYHDVVADFVPPPDAQWREQVEPWRPGLVIAHNDAAPYNCVWHDGQIVGFVDWDMAGPRRPEDDVAWVAFGWVPLHARSVVADEGFGAFDDRAERLRIFLADYGSTESAAAVLDRLADVIEGQIALMHARAAGGDESYRRMIELGRDRSLAEARRELTTIGAPS